MNVADETAELSPGGPETLDRMRLASVPGLSPRLVRRILARFGSATTALRAAPSLVETVPGVGAARAALLAGASTREEAARDLDRVRAAGALLLVEGSPG